MMNTKRIRTIQLIKHATKFQFNKHLTGLCYRYYSTSLEKSLVNQTALITGGSKGIGLSIAKKLSSRGCNCVLLSRNDKVLAKSILELCLINNLQHHSFIAYDLNDLKNIETKIVDPIFTDFTNVSILINCAGKSQASLLPFTSIDDICSLVNINLTSAMILTKFFIRNFLKERKNRKNNGEIPLNIINISSILAQDQYSIRGTSIYSTTKLGILGFTKNVTQDIKRDNIRCNVILPSFVKETEIGSTVNEELLKEQGIKTVTLEDVANKVINVIDKDMNGETIIV
ncbi:hypothetical protein PACTADRAFT_33077 [Pachysolen tannophilus NRRL Y-2460]|uniref:3-oxoacyl-[acyl-carrier-protein] reductase n=1 Tax=Pachysolen tannophilus NRRL Y-2460 TaxID=669874 RepID=A0A1E4TVT0_PACTA|nr:hypothetical protein PACTADRAFT_33077 [Pachysolen tannophilus NRRL Y-2460]